VLCPPFLMSVFHPKLPLRALQSTETRKRRFPTIPQKVHSSVRHTLLSLPSVIAGFSRLGIWAKGMDSTSVQAAHAMET
jgi:hypothetical protein